MAVNRNYFMERENGGWKDRRSISKKKKICRSGRI
jgi:hypothetical protein